MNERTFQNLDFVNAGITLVAFLGGKLFLPEPVAFGLAAGAALMTLNLFLIRKILSPMFRDSGSKVIPFLFFFLKLGGFFGLAAATLYFLPISSLAFGGGVALIVFASMIGMARVSQAISHG